MHDALSPQQKKNTCGDCKDGHEYAVSRKVEIQEMCQAGQDEPEAQEDCAEISAQFHMASQVVGDGLLVIGNGL
jgi:hypothetical protein